MTGTRSAPAPSLRRPRTPVPQFKYIDDPDEYQRGYARRQTPFEGDFCVMSLDPVASVAHLGAEAMESAKRIPSGRYVAFVGLSHGLPFEGRPTNPFTLAPVCQGIPPQSSLCDATPACIPILPNADCYGGRQPIAPIAPFPWPDCYISTFTAEPCRITTAKRDYSQVLFSPNDLGNARANRLTAEDRERLFTLKERRDRGDAEALERLPPTTVGLSTDLSFLPPLPAETSPDGPVNQLPKSPSSEEFPAFDMADFPPELAGFGFLAAALFNPGSVDLPVVNIWYDLDMVTEVRDPQLFATECEMIEKVKEYYDPTQCAARSAAAEVAEVAPASGVKNARTATAPPLSTPIDTTRLDAQSPTAEVASETTAYIVDDGAVSLESATADAVSSEPLALAVLEEGARDSASFGTVATSPTSITALGSVGPKLKLLIRSSSRHSVRRSTSRTSPRSSHDTPLSSASPTKREFVPLSYDRHTRSMSALSFAVPRSRHNPLKSLKKSRSSSSLKAPRRASTLPVTRSLR
ncbi:unnamed protein product [Peniophora sp. CBMAI 1063]|nr:unnamed protein product [Peniophora sp. CBMAI 1063]